MTLLSNYAAQKVLIAFVTSEFADKVEEEPSKKMQMQRYKQLKNCKSFPSPVVLECLFGNAFLHRIILLYALM